MESLVQGFLVKFGAMSPSRVPEIEFDMRKRRDRLSLAGLAKRLDQENPNGSSTGRVNPKYVLTDFYFKQAHVVLNSVQEYTRECFPP